MNETVKVLHVEDDAIDAELCEHELRRVGLNFTTLRVSSRQALEEALQIYPDLVLSDFNLRSDPTGSSRWKSCITVAKYAFHPRPAFFDRRAVNAMRAGATDYVLKDRIERLGPVVKRACVEEKRPLAMEHALQQRVRSASSCSTFPRADQGRRRPLYLRQRHVGRRFRREAREDRTPSRRLGGERAGKLRALTTPSFRPNGGTRVFSTGERECAVAVEPVPDSA